MVELLMSAASWVCGGRATTLSISTSLLAREACSTAAPLEVAPLGSRPSLRLGGGSAPVHHMGGGPRTFPGGVTKWQWRRMQLKKSRQIEKARLMREKHIYEARRRAELLAASPVLEMPWQKMSRVRPPNYTTADEQITKLAGRFHRRGAEDLWTEKDGPERFEVLEDKSSREFSTIMANHQDMCRLSSQNAAKSDEQWHSGVQEDGSPSYPQSFRHMPPIRSGTPPPLEPRIRPGSTPPSEHSFKRKETLQIKTTPVFY